MAKTNVKSQPAYTHEGAKATAVTGIDQLRRTTMACLLWENSFYEDGKSVADRIKSLVPTCKPYEVAELAVELRTKHNLRHVPLLLVRYLAKVKDTGSLVSETLNKIVQRPDELTEFVSLYWKDGKEPLSAQVKKGLAKAFTKFNAYSLAKYNRDAAVKLRDVLFMTHAKPKDEEQAATWKKLVDGTLEAPDTWEVSLSAGADKKETFTRLLSENKLGYLALLRNLRNMNDAGVDRDLVQDSLAKNDKSKVLPFRFVAAARAAPSFEPALDKAMQETFANMPKLSGKTVVLVDVSVSMGQALSSKSDLSRLDAACALAVLVRGISEDVRVFSFSERTVEVPARNGMALIEAINKSQRHGCTYLGSAVTALNVLEYDRLIVVTDEQSADSVPAPKGKGYMINVATYQNGVGYGQWTKINGFSESVVDYIQALEAAE